MPPAYRLDRTAEELSRLLAIDPAGDPWPGGEVVPGGYGPVIVTDRERGRHLVPRQWGVPPPPRGEHLVPFLRNFDSPFWIGTLRHTQFRCLVPLTHLRRGAAWFTPAAGSVCACAGIWRDSEIPSFAIVTAGSGGLPVIVPPAAFDLWLTADLRIARRLVEAEGPAAE